MRTLNITFSVFMYSMGTLLLFVGVLTAAGLIGIPIMNIGKKMQDASYEIGKDI